jgi:hypothetical protein
MSKGITDAQKAKERLWTESDFKSGTIKSIRYMDSDNQYIGGPSSGNKKKGSIPVYGMTEVNFENDSGEPIVSASIPCTLKEAQEYYVGQKVSVELVTGDDSDDE